MSRRFVARWIPLREAARFVALHHRHHDPAQGGIVALGLWEGSSLVGVGVLGRPVSRMLQAAGAAEITRLCVLPGLAPSGNHAAGAASMLAARLRFVAGALGFERVVTYTLPAEGGASLRAAGFQADLTLAGGGEWGKASRPRAAATAPVVRKQRWWSAVRRQRDLCLDQPQ